MHILSGRSCEFTPALQTAIAEYRHKIFIERLGWPLPSECGMEHDQFDGLNTLYVIARDSHGALCGCARLLPTTEPYLLSEVFPGLLASLPPPRAPDIWELSRFAATHVECTAAVNAATDTRRLLAAVIASAIEQSAKRLITVSPLGIERLLHRMGVHAHRAAPPLQINGKPVFACWIEIDKQTTTALGIACAERYAGDVYPEFNHQGLQTMEEEQTPASPAHSIDIECE